MLTNLLPHNDIQVFAHLAHDFHDLCMYVCLYGDRPSAGHFN